MEEVQLIYRLYADDHWTLSQIKQLRFNEAQIQEIACAITHAQLDIQQIPYDQRPRFSFEPSLMDLSEFKVGNSSQ